MCGKHIIQGLDAPCGYEHCSVTDTNPLTHHLLYQIIIVGVYKKKQRYAIVNDLFTSTFILESTICENWSPVELILQTKGGQHSTRVITN